MLLRALLLAASLAQPAQAFCFLGCDSEISKPAAAKAALETQLGQTIPDSVTVEHILQGGFQEKFIQVRISTDQDGAEALLALLGVPPDPVTPLDPLQLGPSGPEWWTPQAEIALFGGPGTIPGYAETIVGIAPFPGTYDQVTIYIFAFQT
jgi:hypothetical protein